MSTTERHPRSFYLAVVANFFFFAGFQWTFATLPSYIQEIGGDAAQIGLAFGLFSLSAVLARPGIGLLVDRWGRKPVLLAGAAVFTLSPVLYALTHSMAPFLAIRVLHGVGIAAFTTAYTTLVADLAPPLRRGEALGLSGVTNNLGLLFAPSLGMYTLSMRGYEVHFALSAAITAASLVILLLVFEPRRDEPSRDDAIDVWSVVGVKPVWVAAFAITGLAVAYGAILSFLAPFAAEQGLMVAGGYFSAFAVAMIAAQATAGWLSDRIGRRAVAVPGLAVTMLAMICLATARSDAALLAAGAVFGLSWGLTRAGLDAALVDAVAPPMRGTAVGLLYTSFDFGVGAGSFGLGVVAQARDYAAAFYAAAAWAVVALAGYLTWGRRRV